MASWVASLLLVLGAAGPSLQAAVNVTLYYESLCPDSIRFVKQQLYPAWKSLSPECLRVDFVPYGKASQERLADGHWSFSCQHGPRECLGNKQQACALHALRDLPALQVEFVHCFMAAADPPSSGAQCAKTLNITYSEIEKCSSSQQGEDLLAALGDKTKKFNPELSWVPTPAFNNVYDAEDLQESMTDFLSAVCKRLDSPKPAACSEHLEAEQSVE
ncbi:GILT-like protein 1 [Bacillus rossius redtenbacheri]|uniref:GILT-like protein 1 n=1 Tax=Bacillus rossius redtenbacheri TaxID=93214 RepID=UPI002FDD7339